MESSHADRTGFGLSATHDLSGAARRRPIARPALLLGSSLLAYMALPGAALAANECGAPPPGGGTVTCTPAGNPYPGGIDYDPPMGLVADLTVVLQPGVVVTNNGNVVNPNGVEIGSSSEGVDLVLQAGTNTLISTGADNHDGVDVVSTDGTVSVAVDDVSTTGLSSDAVIASGRGSVVVTGDTISTIGNYAYGVRAEEGDFILAGDPTGPIGPTRVTTNSVTTSGTGSVGISAFGQHEGVIVDSGIVTTAGESARGILALGVYGEVRVTSDSVSTEGANAIGIDAEVLLFPDEEGPGASIFIDSGSVTTIGDGATGILAGTPLNDITIESVTVSTQGDNARGISALINGQLVAPGKYTYGDGDIVIDSGTVTTLGMNSDGIEAAGADAITITSDSVSTQGDRSAGIYARTYFGGDIVITSGSATTTGNTDTSDDYGNLGNAHAIEARANNGSVTITSTTVSTGDADSGTDAFGILATSDSGAVNITSGTVTTRGAGAIGISAGTNVPLPDLPASAPPADLGAVVNLAPVATPPGISITSVTVTTHGDRAGGIVAETADGDIFIESGSITTTGDTILAQPGVVSGNAHGIEAASDSGSITIDSATVATSGSEAIGIFAESASGAIDITSGTITTVDGEGIDAESGDGNVTIESVSVTTLGGLFSHGIIAETDSSDIVIDSGTVSVGHGVGLFAITQSGNVTITSDEVTVTGDGAGINASGEYYTGGDVSVTSGSVVTHGFFTAGIDADSRGAVSVVSTSVTTTGERSTGIETASWNGGVTIDSGTVATAGTDSRGIKVNAYNASEIDIDSGTVTTLGDNGDAIVAVGDRDIRITSTSVSTEGHRSVGIYAYNFEDGDIVVTSGAVATAGDTQDVLYGGSHGIELHANGGSITVGSATIGTAGAGSFGILATSNTGAINITSGTVTTSGTGAIGISAATGPGSTTPELPPTEDAQLAGDIAVAAAPVATPPDISITSSSIATTGDNAPGLSATTIDGDIYIESGSVQTSGAASTGIFAETKYGTITIDSGTVVTSGIDADGINATVTGGELNKYGGGPVVITSDSVTTVGADSEGINASSNNNVAVTSGVVNTSGANSVGINAVTTDGDIDVASDRIITGGDIALGIFATSVYGNVDVANTDLVRTSGDQAEGITGFAFYEGNVVIDSANVETGGASGTGINGQSAYGDVTITSDRVVTTGDHAVGIIGVASSNVLDDEAVQELNGEVSITSGIVSTVGLESTGIAAYGSNVFVASTAVTTAGDDSTGIRAWSFGVRPAVGGGDTIAPLALGPNGGTTVTSGSVTTGGADSPGIDAEADVGDVEIFSTGTVATSGANSPGIRALSDNGFARVEAGAVNATGAGSDAIVITSATANTVVVSGLVRSTSGLAIQAEGAATAVSTLAAGTIRGAIDLTDNADTLANAGTFDAIGTSAFGGGTDIFTNSGTTRSVNGAAVLGGLETFNNTGLVDLADGATGDRLTVGDFVGGANSRLAVDVDFTAGVADVLVTGVATGTTTVDVNAEGSQFGFNDTGILVVDAAAGTGSGAFVLPGGNIDNGYIISGLIFDAANFNFLLVNAPGQPIFETAMVAGMTFNTWHQGADAVESQLETARAPLGGSSASNLLGNGRFGGWIQVYAGQTEREATQSFTAGGTTTTFDVSYEQDYEGVQGGIDHQSGDTIFGLTVGFGRSDTQFEASPSTVELDSLNLGAYAQFASGNFYANILAKVDWVDLETNPGAGLAAQFDAMSYGVRGVAGFRFDFGRFFAEPSVSLSWVTSDLDDYTSGGATVTFDNATSVQGTAGLRVGGAFATSGGGVISPFAGIRLVEEFSGDNESDFTLGSVLNLTQDGPGTHGEASAGITFRSNSVEAFLRGELDFGSDVDGRTIRAGVRLRF